MLQVSVQAEVAWEKIQTCLSCYLDMCGLTWKQRLHTFVTMLCVLCVVCVCVTLSASSEDLDLI